MELERQRLLTFQAAVAGTLFAFQWKTSNLKEQEQYFGIIVQYAFYMLLMKIVDSGCKLGYSLYQKKNVDVIRELYQQQMHLIFLAGTGGALLYLKQTIFDGSIVLFCVAYLIAKYPDMKKPTTINYGVGMACSFYEGYLVHILPNDGSPSGGGFIQKIILYESQHNVIFPVKVLFIVITKTLYCPPDLKEFNKQGRPDLSYLEAVRSLEDVTKDVAGVKSRQYRNSAYKIVRPGARPVHLAVECATPLHTLYGVLTKQTLYHELCAVDASDLRNDFCRQLEAVVGRNPDSRGKCVLVYYDNTNKELNLADILLEEIARIEPNFESIIAPPS